MKNPDFDYFDTLSTEGFRKFLGEVKEELAENDMTFSDLIDFSALEILDFQSCSQEAENESPVSVQIVHWNLASC